MTTFVYVVESEAGHVKIGWSVYPEHRAKQIRSNSPIKTRLIAMWCATREKEAELHDRFAGARCHAEWFLPTAEVRAFADEVRGANVLDIPPWSEIGWREEYGFAATSREARQRRAAAWRAKAYCKPAVVA